MMFKNIDLDKNIILKNKVPLLIKDEDWIKLFGNVKNKNIQYIKEELIEMVKKGKELERTVATLQKEKLHAMKMILGISDAINNENKIETVGLLDEYKGRIEDINEELDDITFELETIPQDIRELNFNLLKATVDYGYKELKDKEKKLKYVIDELETLRERVKKLINEKYDYEEWIDSTYSFLHGMLGSERMEKLDEEILD
ncbi:MAG: hypothetical protein GX987_01360 [Tissierellia bacterium]|nr:hypothetical protein [Tissierellia bacterium]